VIYSDFNELKISKLGLGMMRLPQTPDKKIDFEESAKMIDMAIKGGINYFDTAYRYHDGESEVFVGEILSKYPRESYYLADKLPAWICKTRQEAEDIFAEQLKRCKTDYFDFYLLHSVDEESWPLIESFELVDYIKGLKEQGLARHLGLSVHCGPELLEMIFANHSDVFEFVQIQLNYFDWDYINAKELYNIARKYNKPVIVMEPLRGGTLANLPSERASKVLKEASEKSNMPPCSDASYGLRYLRQLEGVMIILSGMSTVQQLEDNIGIMDAQDLTETELTAVSEAAQILREDILVPCTGCNYCYECPSKINIPAIFKQYNESAIKSFTYIWDSLEDLYNKLGPNATSCIKCGNCEANCPQKIKITEVLQEVHQCFSEEIAKGKE